MRIRVCGRNENGATFPIFANQAGAGAFGCGVPSVTRFAAAFEARAKERRRIALDYLAALRTDFEKLVHFAQFVSALSPELDVAHELQGLRLRSEFWFRYQLIRLRLAWDIRPLEAISGLSDLISGWTVRMEEAVSELGERAALLGEFTLPYNGGGDTR